MTDFSTYSAVLRNISFNGKNSLSDFNALITTNSNIGNTKPRTPSISLPYRQGKIRLSRASGTLMFDARTLIYEFKIIEDTSSALQTKIANMSEWLYSTGTGSGADEITDSTLSAYYFTDCECVGITVEDRSKGNLHMALLKATFTCYPLKTPRNGGDPVV